MNYRDDYREDGTVSFRFHSVKKDNTSLITFAGSPSLVVFKGSSTTETTAGISLTVDFDGVTGLNYVNIDLSADAFYEPGYDYDVVVAAGTVDGESVVGYVIASFSIENRTAPTPSEVAALSTGISTNTSGIASLDSTIGTPAGASIAADIAALTTSLGTVATNVSTLLTRVPAALFSGITSLAGWLRHAARSDAGLATDDATSLSEINADGGSGAGTYAGEDHSTQAIRDRGDAAWAAAGGGGTTVYTPLTSTVGPGEITSGFFTAYLGGSSDLSISVVDSAGDPLDLSAVDLDFIVEPQRSTGGDTFVKQSPGDITPSATTPFPVAITIDADDFTTAGSYTYALRRRSDGKLYARGTITVEGAARVDS